MSKIITKYCIYDSRYHSNPDDAYLMEACDTLKEAKHESPTYGDGCVIVREIWNIKKNNRYTVAFSEIIK